MTKSTAHRSTYSLATAILVIVSSFLLRLHAVSNAEELHHQTHYCEDCSLATATALGTTDLLPPEAPIPSARALTISLILVTVIRIAPPTPRSGAPADNEPRLNRQVDCLFLAAALFFAAYWHSELSLFFEME